MSALVIRNLPDEVHDLLRAAAARRGTSVEAMARVALTELALANRPPGIDFAQLAVIRAAEGVTGDGPDWAPELDDPALSREVLGLD